MSRKLEIHGNIPAMVTPFKKDEEIDEEALREIVTELHEKILAGKIKEAFLEGTYPAPIMAALHIIGLNGGYPRKPVLPIKKD